MHFVLSQSITFYHSYSITIISHEKLFLFVVLSKPLFHSEAVFRMSANRSSLNIVMVNFDFLSGFGYCLIQK